jgi:hypothetical protein
VRARKGRREGNVPGARAWQLGMGDARLL